MDVWTCLQADLKGIVNRYLFDDRYKKVKDEYVQLWLHGSPYNNWCEDKVCFVFSGNGTCDANWRDAGSKDSTLWTLSKIYRFSMRRYDYMDIEPGTIPSNY